MGATQGCRGNLRVGMSVTERFAPRRGVQGARRGCMWSPRRLVTLARGLRRQQAPNGVNLDCAIGVVARPAIELAAVGGRQVLATARAVFHLIGGNIGKCGHHVLGIYVREPKRPNTWGVNDPPAAWDLEHE